MHTHPVRSCFVKSAEAGVLKQGQYSKSVRFCIEVLGSHAYVPWRARYGVRSNSDKKEKFDQNGVFVHEESEPSVCFCEGVFKGGVRYRYLTVSRN